MNILVTGGAGYLGSVLTSKLLKLGHKVRVLDVLMFGAEALLPFIYNQNFELIKGDTRNNDTVSQSLEKIDVVFHLAALVGEPACDINPKLTEQINYEATVNIAEKAREKGTKKFIFISTCSNYGISNKNEFATEESPLNPLSLYSKTKIKAEEALLKLPNKKFTLTILRLATLFGLSPRMRFNLLINEMVREAFTKKRVLLYREDAWRPYAHIDDAAEALINVLDASGKKINGEIFNVGTDNYQKKELASIIKKHVPDLVIDNKGGYPDNRDYKVSFDKMKNVIGFVPKKTVEAGIAQLFHAVRNNYFDNLYEKRYESWINESVLDNL